MAEIILSAPVRNNLLSLQNTAILSATTQKRLATGLKVNSALDDPTAFFTAASLNNRAGDLNRLLDSAGLAVKTLEAADNALGAITKLVETAQATARQALEASAITDVATATGNLDISAETDLGANVASLDDLDEFTVQVGTATAVTVTIADGDGVTELLADINAISGVTATTTTDGYLNIAADDVATDLILDDLTTDTALAALGITEGTIAGTTSTERSTLATEYDALRSQIDALAGDAGFNGINLLQSDDLNVIFNEDSTSSLTVNGVDFDSAGLSISASTVSFQTDTAINSALTELSSAIDTLRSQASTFGSNLSVVQTRQDFTRSLINTLETGAAGLTLADTNEEGANLLALQTRQQLSSTALSLASQADQNVLRLF
ncbi:Flagellar cap protein FliD [hydrothermal vent metagenome]|uniref:Flagellar cap protein FliD n=1 Tax=hydrothermal vent metagenome TaxID=652676 RepID=A0A3B0T5S6_9ZZZZ